MNNVTIGLHPKDVAIIRGLILIEEIEQTHIWGRRGNLSHRMPKNMCRSEQNYKITIQIPQQQ